MMAANLPVAFAALLAGGLLLEKGLGAARDAFAGSGGSVSATGLAATAGRSSTTAGGIFGRGATGSRLDQGQDLTASTFATPVAGTVVYATSSDPGWRGGGYLAVKADQPFGFGSDIIYWAEGLAPAVKVGQHVNAGDIIANPVSNPYNKIVGSIEWGLANPAAPTQPYAQVIPNPVKMVQDFYRWALSVGAPSVTSTANAGYA